MPDDNIISSRIQATQLETGKTQAASNELLARGIIIGREESEESFQQWIDEGAFNPILMARRFETLEAKTRRRGRDEETEKTEKKEKGVLEIQKLQEISEQYQHKNPELQQRILLLLRARLSADDTKDDILRKVLETYSDYSLADEAMDFLLETTDGKLAQNVKLAKEELNALFGREVRAGKNIGLQAREFSSQGLGSPTALRDMYRDITGNPRDAATLFNELAQKFTYAKMRTVVDFILHSLGSDLKAKGPSISRAELHRMLTELRSMQAILGVYRYFNSRMRMIGASFDRQGLALPPRVNFELLAKYFVRYLMERYPSSDKALQLALLLGIQEELAAQIIIFTQMRDAIRQVAPRLFKSEQHRHDVLMTFIEALEELDEQLEEKEEKEEEEEEEEGQEKE